MALRIGLGLLCAALASALGALILGEYELEGTLALVAGPLFGLVVGELVVGIGRSRALLVAGAAGVIAGLGVAWAGWIDAGEGLEPVKDLAWVAAVLAATTAALRTAGLRRLRP